MWGATGWLKCGDHFITVYQNIKLYTVNIYIIWDLPGGPVVKNRPYNAGDAGSIPGQGTEIACAAGQMHPRPTAPEPDH